MADEEASPVSETTTLQDTPGDVTIPSVPVDVEARQAIAAHIEHYLEKPALVIHEPAIVNGGIDVQVVRPTMLTPFYSLVTVGMSDLAMSADPGGETFRHAELLLALPQSWPMNSQAWKREEHYWPIRLLRALARMPYLHENWVGPGYAMAHGGEPPRPYARNTRLSGAFVTPPMRYDPDFLAVVVRPEKVVRIHAVIPLYREELAFRHEAGPRALRIRLTEHRVTELLNVRRKSAVGRRWWFGRR